MADGLSVAASIAGLVTLAEAVTRKSYRYVKEAKNSSKEISKLLSETTELYGILHGLHLMACRFESEEFDHTIQTHHVHSCYVLLDKLDSKLLDANPQSYSSSRKDLLKKMAWPFSSVETKEMIAELERQKSTLRLALSVDNMSALLLSLSRQELQGAQLMEIKNDTSYLRRSENERKRRKLLASLTTVEPERNQETSIRLRQPGTGVWFLEHPSFKKWIHEDHGELWLYGIPGAGKTILASTIIQELQKPKYKDKAFSYFYCDYKNPATWNHLNILGSLIKQLASQHDECFEDFQAYDKKHETDASSSAPRIKSTEDAIVLLHQMANHFDQTMIVIDGLDEIGASDGNMDRSGVTLVLKDLVCDNSSVKTIFLSRREFDLSEVLSGYEQVSIAAQSSDLKLYVGSEIENRIKEKRLRIKNEALKEEIRERLVEGADGMFRWVACQIDYLCQLPSDGARRKALARLPPTLHETYERILARIDGDDNRESVKLVLLWTVYSRQTLPIKVLLEAIAIKYGSTSLDEDDIYDEETILTLCSSLVRRTSDGSGLELAHFTVKEFLLDEKKQPKFAFFHLDQRIGDIEIAKTCLTYLCFEKFEPLIDDIEDEDLFCRWNHSPSTLYQYAAGYWDLHACDNFDNVEIMKGARLLFDISRTPQFILWSQFLSFFHAGVAPNSPETLSMTPLHWASCLALQPVCKWLLEKDQDVNKSGGPGTPLQCALRSFTLYGRHAALDSGVLDNERWRPSARFEVVQLLLEKGSKVNYHSEKDFKHDSPLEIAIRIGDISLTRLLLRSGAKLTTELLEMLKVRCQENSNWKVLFQELTPDKLYPESIPLYVELTILFGDGDAEVLHHMLEDDAEGLVPMRVTDELGSALRRASRLGQIATLTKLLSRGRLDVNAVDEVDGQTALHHAAEVGHSEAVKLLVESGSDIDKTNNQGDTAIHVAVGEGHIDIYRYLKEQGANLRHVNENGMTLFHAAASGPNSALLEELLCNATSSDLKARTKDGSDLLLCAAERGSSNILKFLLGRTTSSEVHSTSNDGWNCLHFAADCYDEDTIKVSLAAGVDVNGSAEDGSTPLHILLDSMVRQYPSNCGDSDFDLKSVASADTAEELDDIASNEFIECFRHLLSAGNKVTTLRNDGLSPLHILCRIANQPCVSMLEEIINTTGQSQSLSGEETLYHVVNHKSKDGATALHLLVSNLTESYSTIENVDEMINLILKSGVVDINCPDNAGKTPLISLALAYHLGKYNYDLQRRIPDRVSTLLSHGANVNSVCMKGKTALHYFWLGLTELESQGGVYDGQCIEMLLSHSAKVDLRDYQGQSVLELLCLAWTSKIIVLSSRLRNISLRIIEAAATSDLRNIQVGGSSALSIAIEAQDETIAHALLDRGCRPDSRNTDKDKHSALEIACIRGCSESVARRLVDKHPNINQLHQSGFAPLHFASQNNQDVLVKELLLHNVDINAQTRISKRTPLHLATENGNLSPINLLLAKGADVKLRALNNWTLAHSAAQLKSNGEVCEIIFEHLRTDWNKPALVYWPPPLNTTHKDELTPLQLAALNGNAQVIDFLLRHSLVSDINQRSKFLNYTPLHLAATFNSELAIKSLVMNGADVNALSTSGETPLHLAVIHSGLENARSPENSISLLLEYGSNVEKRAANGLTTELLALAAGREDIAKIISKSANSPEETTDTNKMECEAVPQASFPTELSSVLQASIVAGKLEFSKRIFHGMFGIDNALTCGCSPLILSLAYNQLEISKVLLEAGADISGESCEIHGDGLGSAHLAAWNGQDELLRQLLLKNPPLLSSNGVEAIHAAALSGNPRCLEVLLKYEKSTGKSKVMLQALVRSKPKSHKKMELNGIFPDQSALHIACSHGHEKAVSYLLGAGADTEIRSPRHQTPLIAAVYKGYVHIARILLLKGANVNARGDIGETPFLIAANTGSEDMLDLLLEFKCDATAQDNYGATALHISHERTIPKLLSLGFDLEALDFLGASALLRLMGKSDESGVLALNRTPGAFNPVKYARYGNILTAACTASHINSARKILEGVPVDIMEEYVNFPSTKGTPLYTAAYVGCTAIIEPLIDSKALVNIIGGPLGTALHAACSTGRDDIVSLLFKRGAKMNFYQDDGSTISAFDRAKYHPRVLEVLRQYRLMLRQGWRRWQNQRHLLCIHSEQKLWHFGRSDISGLRQGQERHFVPALRKIYYLEY